MRRRQFISDNVTEKQRKMNDNSKRQPLLETIIIIRHGSYSEDGGLDKNGRIQITKSAEQLKEVIKGKGATIVTSPLKRAVESSQIIADMLKLSLEKDDALSCESVEKNKLKEFIEKLKQKKKEVIILVTHQPNIIDICEILLDSDYVVPTREMVYLPSGGYHIAKKQK
ncbi:MAG: phosphoglycerate mutase family protein [Candidatus Bilamarchaeaceae archaeon]